MTDRQKIGGLSRYGAINMLQNITDLDGSPDTNLNILQYEFYVRVIYDRLVVCNRQRPDPKVDVMIESLTTSDEHLITNLILARTGVPVLPVWIAIIKDIHAQLKEYLRSYTDEQFDS